MRTRLAAEKHPRSRTPGICTCCGKRTNHTYTFPLHNSEHDYEGYDTDYVCPRCASLDMEVEHDALMAELEGGDPYDLDLENYSQEILQRAFECNMIPSGLLESLADC